MKGGAVDFLTKPVNDEELLKAIHLAFENDRTTREVRQKKREIEANLSLLTPREREVLEHVISGSLNKQVAAALGTSERTIKAHRARIMDKMKVESLAELVRLSEQAGVQVKSLEI
jgi:FixJ family two-component response regulator